MMKKPLDVSFIIPCFNEERWIATTISIIKKELEDFDLLYEIIVIDNQSQDRSANIAKSAGADVYYSSAKTVGAVRNFGFLKSCGEFVVFLDCDVYLCKGWGLEFLRILRSETLNEKTVTGSHCATPDNLKEPLRSWYKGIEKDQRDTHLGTGHMIMSSLLFKDVGMFNEELISGEDYEFCRRVIIAGGNILNNNKLRVFHMDYPETIKDFIKRERWHGTSDFKSLDSILGSKIAIATIIFILLNILTVSFLLISRLSLMIASFSFLVFFLILVVIKKFSFGGFRDLIFKTSAAYFYFFGRSMSIGIFKPNKDENPK